MPNQIPQLASLSVQELCQAVLESEEYPCREGLAMRLAREVFDKPSPIDVEIIRLGKYCAYELARRFMATSKPRWMVIKYWRGSPDKEYRATMRYTHYDKLRAINQMSYFDAQFPFAKDDVYYELVETFDFDQTWHTVEIITKDKPRAPKG